MLQAVSDRLAGLGWGIGTLYLAARLLHSATRGYVRIFRYHLVAQPIPHAAVGQRSSAKTIVRIADRSDPIVGRMPRPVRVIERRFRAGATCFVAESAGRLCGFLWIAHRAYDEDEVRCRFELAQPKECVWDFDVHVEPEFRLGRTFARLWDAANHHLDQQGIRWTLSRISAFNPASLSAHGRLGVRILHSATFLRAGRLQIAVLSLPPFLHVSVSERYRPTLRLSPPRD